MEFSETASTTLPASLMNRGPGTWSELCERFHLHVVLEAEKGDGG